MCSTPLLNIWKQRVLRFIIDYAKTLYQPTRPPEWDERIRNATNGKVPAFFKYAKGKLDHQVNPRGNGVVDRLFNTVQIYKFRFNATSLGKFDYRMLMYDENIPYGEKEERLVQEFRKASSKVGMPNVSMYDDGNHYFWDIKELRKRFLQYGSLQYITDVLVRGMFYEHNVKRKSTLFDCFGDQIYENLSNNLPLKTHLCQRCGKRFVFASSSQMYCDDCIPLEHPRCITTAECVVCGSKFKTRSYLSGAVCPVCLYGDMDVSQPKMLKKQLRKRKPKATRCVDCGALLHIYRYGRPSNRCESCQSKRNRLKSKEWKINKRKKAD